MKRIYPKTRTNKVCSVTLKSDFYIVFINPNIHKSDWNALRLIMEVTEINYCVFLDNEIKVMEIYSVSKDEFRDYYYNPN
jgi:predicted CoA-binding protein